MSITTTQIRVSIDKSVLAMRRQVKDNLSSWRIPFSTRSIIAITIALVFCTFGTYYVITPKSSVSTDDAYLKADNTTVAPKVRGFIAKVLVRDNQAVKAGDPLVLIESEEFDAHAASALADLKSAEAGVEAAKAALVSQEGEERLAASNVKAARALIDSADAQKTRTEADQKRYDRLILTGAATQRDADLYRATAVTARSEAERSRAMLEVSQSQEGVVHAKRAALKAQLAQAEASVARAKAALDLARQDQAHSLILAPVDGVVGNRLAQPGDYVQPGSRLMTLVPLHAIYALANFKETQTDRMTPGQRVRVGVDALPGVELTGEVESLAPGSGSEFALLPFEPGTGNFTKIVQRVPVRIRFDPDQSGLIRLRPGLSATIKVSLAKRAER